MRVSGLLHLAAVLSLAVAVEAVKREDFKTCEQSAFCLRHRRFAEEIAQAPGWPSGGGGSGSGSGLSARSASPYSVVDGSVRLEQHTLVALVSHKDDQVPLRFEVSFLASGTVRVRAQEEEPLAPRFDDTQRYTLRDEGRALPYALLEDLRLTSTTAGGAAVHTVNYTTTTGDGAGALSVRITERPWSLTLLRNDKPAIQLNSRGFFRFEHLRSKPDGDVPDGEWEETFRTWTDSKPRGPESFGLDVSFAGCQHVYGIPEHASPLSLKSTRGGAKDAYDQPYRLYNLDVFEYEIDNPMALYGSVPLMLAHSAEATTGVLWLNAAETWVDVAHEKTSTIGSLFRREEPAVVTHWISEAGVMDVFLFPGPGVPDVYKQYAELVEQTPLPRDFALGHHQSRWNYLDEADVLSINDRMHEHDIPYDVVWLDIEYTDGKRYFTWDAAKFPAPAAMQDRLARDGHQLVVVIDPHIKRDPEYRVWAEANDRGFFVKTADGAGNFQGWCWPGDSAWIDYFNPDAARWLGEQYGLAKFNGSTASLFVWNDMNEPSVFNGPEISMDKDLQHHGGWEHRAVHNLYGMLYHQATANGLRARQSPALRPFVLSRAYFAGSQRYGAIWTGDNAADWAHLRASVPMILSNNVAGMHFAGADVGGFFGNPDAKLLTRWYQLGVWYPFFRAHAHIDTKRREPWLMGEPYLTHIRDAIRERYRLLPYWYTLFREASLTGMPLVRPMWVEFPGEKSLFAEDKTFMVGPAIMVAPVTDPDPMLPVEVVFPLQENWYDMKTHEMYNGPLTRQISAGLGDMLVFARGGSIIPTRERRRRSATLMRRDPFTLYVYVGRTGTASGKLYVDDGESYDYEGGAFIERELSFAKARLVSRPSARTASPPSAAQAAFSKRMAAVRIERVVVVGLRNPLTRATIRENGDERTVELGYRGAKVDAECVIRDPAVRIGNDWEIVLS
ncbi:glucosidase II [Coemansia javaensis]|uniref:Glucosidase II subunit alpha n=1 Tax=Coemansia javaensis TaxID=2761396 RepID=A0A9W8H350_9FUNG|nr:glucosidase II [Coemansia javaensis]